MAPYNRVREAPMLKGENCHWKEITINTGASQPVLQDVNYPDCCGGFTYHLSAVGQTFRSVYWRTSQSTLELLEVSSSQNLIGNALRITFQDTPIVPRVCIQETISEVVALVTTTIGVHRLLFPHPSKVQRKDFQHSQSPVPSIFANSSVAHFKDPSNFHEFNHGGSTTFDLQCSSAWLTPETKAWFALGTKSGSLLLVCLPRVGLKGISIQEEAREASIMQRIWSGIVPGAMRFRQEALDTADSVVIRPFGQTTVAFAVCRDHRLRAWTCTNQECVISFDLLELVSNGSDFSEEPPLLHHMIRSAEGAPHKSPILGIFLSLSKSNAFVILQPFLQSGQYQVHHLATVYGVKGQTLVDFTLSTRDLFTIWSLPTGDNVVQKYVYDGQSKGRWFTVSSENPPPSEVKVPDDLEPREAYMEVIFKPGNFSTSCLTKAFNTYSRAVGLLPAAGNWYIDSSTLRAEVSAVIENEIQQKIGGSVVSQEDYRHLLEQSLSRFYSCCLEYQRVAEKPGGVVLDAATGVTYIIKKDAVSVLTPSDQVIDMSDGSRAEDLCENGWIQEDDTVLVHDIWQLYDCVKKLREVTPDSFYEDVITSEEMVQSAAGNIASEVISSPDVNDLVLSLQTLHKPSKALKTLLETLDLAEGKPDGLLPNDDFVYSSVPDTRLSGAISTRMLAAGFASMAVYRFHFMADLLLLECVMDKLVIRLSGDRQLQWQLQENLIPETAKLMEAYLSLHRFSQWEATPVETGSIESSIRQMAALEISDLNLEEPTRPNAGEPGSIPNPTVLELFIAGSGGLYMRAILGQGTGQLQDWNSLSYHAIITLAKLMWPVSASFIFPEFLMNKCQYTNVEKYVNLLDKWCDWNAASRRFILGHSYLNLGAPEKAVACFTQAAHMATKEDFLMSKILPTDELEGKREDTVYHLKVIRLLEQFSVPDLVVEYSRSALSFALPGDKNIPTLWTKIFKHELELGHEDKAYAAITANPHPEIRRDCLRQFVVVLCDRGLCKDLVQLPYVDLHDEMVAILEERARSVDLQRNGYYHLLYSFHIHRGNYRKAASAMYEHASRLGVELPGIDSLQRQCDCYLATINTLRIVDPKYQWMVKPVAVVIQPKTEDVVGASPKRDYDGEFRDVPVTRRVVKVLELSDIEKEYLLVSARWRLARFDPEYDLVSGTAMNADETVANLVRAGLFDCAIEVCQSFKLELNPVFESLASKCVRVSRSGANSKTWHWLSANTPAKLHCPKESSPADLAWDLLKVYLTRHHHQGDSTYYRVVVAKLLSLGFSLPQWLIKSIKEIDCPALLRLYISYDKLEEAALLALELIQAVRGELGDGCQDFGLKEPLRSTARSVWLPYSSLDHILLALKNTTDPGLSEMYQKLHRKMDEYQEEARRVSDEMIQMALRRQ